MKALALAGLLLLGGCYTYSREVREYRAPPSAAPAERPAPRAASGLSERQAVDVAFQICKDRGLVVSTVQRAHLDGAGRWHVDLAGKDRARLLLDGRDGRLLKGRFKQQADRPEDDGGWADD